MWRRRFWSSMAPQTMVDSQTNFITIMPQVKHTATVIFLHGLGDTAHGWADPMKQLAHQYPHIKFMLPTAKIQPVSLNFGMPMPSWYDIKGLTERANDTCDGIEDSRQLVDTLIQTEISQHGIPSSRIVGTSF